MVKSTASQIRYAERALKGLNCEKRRAIILNEDADLLDIDSRCKKIYLERLNQFEARQGCDILRDCIPIIVIFGEATVYRDIPKARMTSRKLNNRNFNEKRMLNTI